MNAIGNTTSSLANNVSPDNQIQVAVLKKAIDSESQGALALINALPQPQRVNLPAHLGQNVNTSA